MYTHFNWMHDHNSPRSTSLCNASLSGSSISSGSPPGALFKTKPDISWPDRSQYFCSIVSENTAENQKADGARCGRNASIQAMMTPVFGIRCWACRIYRAPEQTVTKSYTVLCRPRT